MNSSTIRRWSFVHTWASLICTLFLLLLCLTGLPLVFKPEIDVLLGNAPTLRQMPNDTKALGLQQLVQVAELHRPGDVIQYLAWDEHEPNGMRVIMATTAAADPNLSHSFMLDIRTGEALETPSANGGFMLTVLRLHTDLFMGLFGKLLMAAMGILFALAVVSGVVLYAPFMGKQPFASVRQGKSSRTRWLDLHNLIGIVTLTWALVVGLTGTVNACADLIINAWRTETLAAMVLPYRNAPPLEHRASAEQLLNIAGLALPDMEADFIAFPGTVFSSPHHYAVFMKGKKALTAHVWTPVLIDASTLQITAIGQRPWYMDVLGMSQPLHFGDYGGLPMRILWGLLDVLTLVVLCSGLYLWWVRRFSVKPRRAAAMGASHAEV